MHGKLEKIPENARCVFDGIQFRIWQWDQIEFDGTTAIYEMAERAPTFWVIAVVGDMILVQEERHAHMPDVPFLSLPGGKGAFEEDPLLGTKRELSEESGYESDDWILYKKEQESGKLIWPAYMHIARNAKKTHDPHPDAGEIIVPILYSVENFFELDQDQRFRGFMLKSILTELRGDPQKKAELMSLLFPGAVT